MNGKTFITALLALTLTAPACAQLKEKLKEIATIPQFGGYLVGRAQYTNDKTSDSGGGFDLRMVRAYVKGTILHDWNYYIQMEYSGAPGVDKGVRLLDAYGEWKKYPEFSVKFGQMKRVFTFENPYSPWNIGYGNYSQLVQKLAGMSDRVGEHSSGGRDAGIVIQGDLFPAEDHRWLHYQVGVYNGQGINQKDGNKRKDVAGMLSVYPLKDLRLAGSFQIGQGHAYADNPYGLFKKGDDYKRNRWSVGTEYFHKYLTLRSEYLRGKDSSADSQGGYVMANIHLHPKLDLMLSYDVLNKNLKTCDKQTDYIAGLQWNIYRKCRFEIQYMHSRRDKGIGNSNLLLTQLQVGF